MKPGRTVVLSVAALAIALVAGAFAPATARTNVDVDLFFRTGAPSHGASFYVSYDNEPEFVRIPDSGVRYVRGGDCDVYYYGGWYYAYDDGYWFRAHDWDGPWGYVNYSYVPQPVVYVPERYRPRWAVVRHADNRFSGCENAYSAPRAARRAARPV